MKNLRNFVVLLTMVAGAFAANAQSSFHARFQLTTETRWGKAVLPVGEYWLTIDAAQQPVRVIIQAVNGKASIIAVAQASADAAPGGSYLFVTGSGSNRVVRSLNLPQIERSLVFEPLTAHDRETLYTKASQTVPVQIAKR
jgi:hypothetical protein